MLPQQFKYPIDTKFEQVETGHIVTLRAVKGKDQDAILTFLYEDGIKPVFTATCKQVDSLISFKSWKQLNNKI